MLVYFCDIFYYKITNCIYVNLYNLSFSFAENEMIKFGSNTFIIFTFNVLKNLKTSFLKFQAFEWKNLQFFLIHKNWITLNFSRLFKKWSSLCTLRETNMIFTCHIILPELFIVSPRYLLAVATTYHKFFKKPSCAIMD